MICGVSVQHGLLVVKLYQQITGFTQFQFSYSLGETIKKLIFIENFSRANWSNSEIKILALTLRDGVLLCNLIHFLDPSMEAIEFNRRPRDAQVFFDLLLHCAKEFLRRYLGVQGFGDF